MFLVARPPSVIVVIDRDDDVIHTHTALAAHHLPAGRITLHPGPGTTSETGLAHDLLAALGKPPLLTGRFPAWRQPAWQAAAAWMTALPVTRLTVLRAHRLTARRMMRLLQLQALTGVHLTLVCHRPHLPAALHQALQTADYSVTADFEAARRHYYGTPITEPPPVDEPAAPADRWLTLPALDRLVSYDSPPPLRHPVHATADCLAAPPTTRSSHRAHRPEGRPPTARGDCTSAPGRGRRRRAVHRRPPSNNSPPPAPATTTLLRPHSPCTTVPATPTAAPPTPYHPGRASSCGLRPASPGSSPARTRNCSPHQVTAGTCCAWRRRPGCARPSRPQPAAKARSAVWSGTGASGRKPSGTKRCRPVASDPRGTEHLDAVMRRGRLSRSRSQRTRCR
jgi:hypothetical protein